MTVINKKPPPPARTLQHEAWKPPPRPAPAPALAPPRPAPALAPPRPAPTMKTRTHVGAILQQTQGHALHGLLVEDLAASRDHGRETVRMGVAPDGNPILYAESEATVLRLSKAVREATAVHARVIPKLDLAQWEVIAAEASQKLLPVGDDDDYEDDTTDEK